MISPEEARAVLDDAARAYHLARKVCQGQRLIFADMVAAGIAIPKRCRQTHQEWLHHTNMLRLAVVHAKANVAQAETLTWKEMRWL